jgi:hypothetical protein
VGELESDDPSCALKRSDEVIWPIQETSGLDSQSLGHAEKRRSEAKDMQPFVKNLIAKPHEFGRNVKSVRKVEVRFPLSVMCGFAIGNSTGADDMPPF